MTQSQVLLSNYGRYFPEKQKVYLVDMSRERDNNKFDSLSGNIISYSGDTLDLLVPYSTGQIIAADRIRNMTYKIVTETFGLGLQVQADLINISPKNVLRLRLSSAPEVFRRFEMPRVDSTIKVFHYREENTLSNCKSKFYQLIERVKKGLPLEFKLKENAVNMSASGIRLVSETAEKYSPLALCVLDIEDGLPPICTIAETAWHRRLSSSTISGHRFITIFKSDQNRIVRFVSAQQKTMGIKLSLPKNNWALLDRMTFEGA